MDKLQRAGRGFLIRLVKMQVLHGAAQASRALADDLDGLPAGNLGTVSAQY